METVISNNWSQNYPFLLNEINLDEFKFTFKLNPFLFASPPSKLLSTLSSTPEGFFLP